MLQSTQTLISRLPTNNPFTISAAEVARLRAEDERRAWRRRIEQAGIPEGFQQARLSDCPSEVRQWFDDYQNGQALWLILSGDNGTGKTYSACAIANKAMQTKQAYFVTMAGLMTKLQGTFGTTLSAESVMHRYTNCPLLVVDELEKFKATDWSVSQMFELFNSRHARLKPTIITTNLEPEKLFAALSAAAGEEMAASLMSRIGDKRNVSVKLRDKDRRLA